MENASKALIIAGAILIAIVIIGVGVFIVSGANNAIDPAVQKMDAMGIQMHNSQFEKYEKEQLKGSDVKQLISTVVANNAAAENSGSGLKVTLTGLTDTDLNKIKPGAQYKVVFKREPTKGVITEINISE